MFSGWRRRLHTCGRRPKMQSHYMQHTHTAQREEKAQNQQRQIDAVMREKFYFQTDQSIWYGPVSGSYLIRSNGFFFNGLTYCIMLGHESILCLPQANLAPYTHIHAHAGAVNLFLPFLSNFSNLSVRSIKKSTRLISRRRLIVNKTKCNYMPLP